MAVVAANPILGIVLHAFGATSAALCYTPQQKLRGWSWQTYWLAQASICWFIAPIIGAWITIPQLADVLRSAPRSAMLLTFTLGIAYGIGGTAFGMAIRHIGYSLTYALAIGISCVLGTLTGPILSGSLRGILDQRGSGWVMSGVFIGLLGTLMCGLAGRLKEVELQGGSGTTARSFAMGKGLLLCGIAGIFSAVYGIAVNDAGKPIAETAARFGAGHWQTNVVYIFSNTGAFVTTARANTREGLRGQRTDRTQEAHVMKRYGMVIGLKQERIEQYRKLHAAVWPDVLKMMAECNIRNYSIYLRRLPDGNHYLFSYFEYEGDDFASDMARMAADPTTQKWWDVCMPCQEPLPDRADGQWWASMEEVFHCD